ncbi:four helix bundle protein [candidate division KSB1 bacterium]|nr:four helix bundle protein [candidate division KSB1 bacterium]
MKSEADGGADLRVRTKSFSVRIVKLFSALPPAKPAQVIGSQVLRSGTSVGAHNREAVRAKSTADYVNKLQGALQELDETSYWLELLVDCKIVSAAKLRLLVQETDELIAILTAIQKKVKRRLTNSASAS